MDHYQLTRFELRDADDNNAVVLVAGNLRYKAILQRAFQRHYFSRTFEDRYGRYEWGTYIYNIAAPEHTQLEVLLKTLLDVVCIEDDLTETFALSYHTQMDPRGGGYSRTALGELVYQAKPYRGGFTQTKQQMADKIVVQMLKFIQTHPTYARADSFIAAPPSTSGRPNLPVSLAAQLAKQLGKTDGTGWITKVRPTRPMKDCKTVQEKIDNLRGAFILTDEGLSQVANQSGVFHLS